MDVTDQKALSHEWIRQPIFNIERHKLILLFRIGRLESRNAEHNTINEHECSGSRTNTMEHCPS